MKVFVPNEMLEAMAAVLERFEEDEEEIAGLRNDVVALTQEVVSLRREIETERRLRLGMSRTR